MFVPLNALAIVGTSCFVLSCWYLYLAYIHASLSRKELFLTVLTIGILVTTVAILQAFWPGTWIVLAALLAACAVVSSNLHSLANRTQFSFKVAGCLTVSIILITGLLTYWPW